jgi:hypothetical protein
VPTISHILLRMVIRRWVSLSARKEVNGDLKFNLENKELICLKVEQNPVLVHIMFSKLQIWPLSHKSKQESKQTYLNTLNLVQSLEMFSFLKAVSVLQIKLMFSDPRTWEIPSIFCLWALRR